MVERKMLTGHTPALLRRQLEDFLARLTKRFGEMKGKIEITMQPEVSFKDIGGLARAVRTFNPLKIFTAMINFFIGLIEIFSEIAKTVSLSLRLFGNVFAGEVLLTVMASLIAYLVPIPFMFLELLVGIVQATIFAMLTLVFMEVATHGEH